MEDGSIFSRDAATTLKLHTRPGGAEGKPLGHPLPLSVSIQYGNPSQWDLWGHGIHSLGIVKLRPGWVGNGCRPFAGSHPPLPSNLVAFS